MCEEMRNERSTLSRRDVLMRGAAVAAAAALGTIPTRAPAATDTSTHPGKGNGGGMPTTEAAAINADLLAFVQGKRSTP